MLDWTSFDKDLGRVNALLSIREFENVDEEALINLVASHISRLANELARLRYQLDKPQLESQLETIQEALIKQG